MQQHVTVRDKAWLGYDSILQTSNLVLASLQETRRTRFWPKPPARLGFVTHVHASGTAGLRGGARFSPKGSGKQTTESEEPQRASSPSHWSCQYRDSQRSPAPRFPQPG